MSSAIAPVGITAIGARPSSPRRITEPLPYCLSICARASSSALSLSGAAGAMEFTSLVGACGGSCQVFESSFDCRARSYGQGPTIPGLGGNLWIAGPGVDNSIDEHLFDGETDTPLA